MRKFIKQSPASKLILLEHFGQSFGQMDFANNLANQRRIIDENLQSEQNGSISQVKELPSNSSQKVISQAITANQPFVIRNFASSWNCIEKWNIEFFINNYGDHSVDILDGPSSGTSKSFREAIGNENGQNDYIRFSDLVDQTKALQADLNISSLPIKAKRVRTSQLFISRGPHLTHWHSALTSNLFIQIFGSKIWHIVDPSYTELMQPRIEGRPFFMSEIGERVPNHLPLLRVRLNPGDVLFNPSFFWHMVKNPESSIGLGLRWIDWRSALNSSPLLTFLTLSSTKPTLLKSLKRKKSFTKTFLRN